MILIFTQEARDDIENIHAYIAPQSLTRAYKVVARIRIAIKRLDVFDRYHLAPALSLAYHGDTMRSGRARKRPDAEHLDLVQLLLHEDTVAAIEDLARRRRTSPQALMSAWITEWLAQDA